MFITSRYRRALTLSVFAIVFIACGRTAASAASRLEAATMPRTLKAEAGLMPQIQQMLDASPTFRKQCERLDSTEKLAVRECQEFCVWGT
jgi:hypothetical protein